MTAGPTPRRPWRRRRRAPRPPPRCRAARRARCPRCRARGHADPQALDAVGRARAQRAGTGSGSRWSRGGSWPAITSSSQARRRRRWGEGPDLVEARGEGDEPVAADTRRRWASCPTTPHSAAGWRIEPPVSEPSASGAKPAATAAALSRPRSRPAPGEGRAGCGWAERRVLGGGAHGELVEVGLADDHRAGGRRRSTTVASYGGRQPLEDLRDEQVVGTPRVHRLSLSATGTPASGPGSSPAATGVDLVGRGPGLVGQSPG
jgi:hypothetical protein